MCRHLAYLGPPRTLASLLYEPSHSLEHQSWAPRLQTEVNMNADGWGVGWWDRSVRAEPARYRTVTPMWADRALRGPAELVSASAIFAAARAATPPAPVVEVGNAPFTAGPWLFSLNGYVVGYAEGIGEQLRRDVSMERARGIDGTSDSEVLFALLLDRLDRGAALPDAVDDLVGTVCSRGPAKLNLLVGDGESIVATACGNSLFSSADSGLSSGGVLIASEPLDDGPGWSQVAEGSLVRASGTSVAVSSLSAAGGAS